MVIQWITMKIHTINFSNIIGWLWHVKYDWCGWHITWIFVQKCGWSADDVNVVGVVELDIVQRQEVCVMVCVHVGFFLARGFFLQALMISCYFFLSRTCHALTSWPFGNKYPPTSIMVWICVHCFDLSS